MNLSDQRHIAHLDLDAFFVSVECLKDSRLHGKPLLVGGSADRGVVAACSYEARRYGIHSAMPMKVAKRLCPHAIVIRGDHEDYSKYSKLVTAVIGDKVPLYEKASIDEFYLDLTGMDRYFGCEKFTGELKKTILRESGLPVSYALAGNKLVSKVATNEVKPNGQVVIPAGFERAYLAPLNVARLPGVGKETGLLLMQMGVETVRTLSEIPRELLHNLLGKSGTDLWRKANGVDDSPVVPYREQKSISTESTFQADTIDLAFLRGKLVQMTELIAFQLREQGRVCGCITVKLRYSNFDTVTRQASVSYTAADHVLIHTAKELFEKLFDRRMLVRLLGVRFTQLIPGHYQINLFEDTQEMIQLYKAIDSIKHQFGAEKLMRGAGLPVHSS